MNHAPHEEHAKVDRIWKNAAWLASMPLVLNVISVLSAALITRSLGAEAFGRFSMGTAMVGLTGMVTDFGLRALAVRELSRAGPGSDRMLGDLLSVRLVLAVIGTVIAVVMALAVSTASGLAPVILVTAITIIPLSIAGSLTDGLMARNRARAISSAVFWSGILLTGASVIAAVVWRSATALAAAYVVGPVINMIMLVAYARGSRITIRFRWRPRNWRAMIRRAIPFFRLDILSVVIGRLDTIVIGAMFGEGVTGVYTAASSLTDRLYILIDSVASSVLPTLARLRRDPPQLASVLGQMLFPLLAVLTAGTIAAVAGSTAAVTVVFSSAFAAGGPVLAIGLVLLPIRAVDALLAEGFLGMRRDDFVVKTGVRGQFINLILLPVCVAPFGMIGARIARTIGTFVSVIPRIQRSRTELPGLWHPARLRLLMLTVAAALPIPALLVFLRRSMWLRRTVRHGVPLSPLTIVVVALAGFVIWCAVAAKVYGGVQVVKDLLARRAPALATKIAPSAES